MGEGVAFERWQGYRGLWAAMLLLTLMLAAIIVLVMSMVPEIGEYGPKRPFPEIRDWSSLRIRLERSLCYGYCPSYVVEIRGDGSVEYQGRQCVAIKGRRTRQISENSIRVLVRLFRESNYFSLRDSYESEVTDSPTFRTTIRFDGQSKSVVNYAGEGVGMPQLVTILERAIDATAETQSWVFGGPRPCPMGLAPSR